MSNETEEVLEIAETSEATIPAGDEFYFVYCPGGCALPDASENPRKHHTYAEAEALAVEAAQAKPGSPVYICGTFDVAVCDSFGFTRICEIM